MISERQSLLPAASFSPREMPGHFAGKYTVNTLSINISSFFMKIIYRYCEPPAEECRLSARLTFPVRIPSFLLTTPECQGL